MIARLLIDGAGVAAAICSMASFVPQAVKIIRQRDATSVSLRMYLLTVTGFALWATYGVLLHSWPLIASNCVNFCLSGAILILKLRMPKPPAGGRRGRRA